MPHNASFHVPVDASVAEALGNPRCAFVTAGPSEYLAGINCIGRRLDMVGSRYPLLVMVEPEQEAFMRRHVTVNSHPSSAVLPWRRFPEKVARNDPWRYRSAHVMDKMTRAAEWASSCGPLVCNLMFNQRRNLKNVSRDDGRHQSFLMGITSSWEPYCAIANSSQQRLANDSHSTPRLHTRHAANSSMLGGHKLAAGASLRHAIGISDLHPRYTIKP